MKLLCLGDSLTYGYDVACEYRWTTRLAKEKGISVCNEGLCGDTTGGMLYRARRMKLAPFDAFFFMGGSNDILMDISPDQVRQNPSLPTRRFSFLFFPASRLFRTTVPCAQAHSWQAVPP